MKIKPVSEISQPYHALTSVISGLFLLDIFTIIVEAKKKFQ